MKKQFSGFSNFQLKFFLLIFFFREKTEQEYYCDSLDLDNFLGARNQKKEYKLSPLFQEVRKDKTNFEKKSRHKRGYKFDVSGTLDSEKIEKGVFDQKKYQVKMYKSCPFFVYTHTLYGKQATEAYPNLPKKNIQEF